MTHDLKKMAERLSENVGVFSAELLSTKKRTRPWEDIAQDIDDVAKIHILTALQSAYDAGRKDAVPQWLPIESAPKMKDILCAEFNCYGKWEMYMAFYAEHDTLENSWDADEDYAPEGFYKLVDNPEVVYFCKPTHWMPLPAAPNVEDGR